MIARNIWWEEVQSIRNVNLFPRVYYEQQINLFRTIFNRFLNNIKYNCQILRINMQNASKWVMHYKWVQASSGFVKRFLRLHEVFSINTVSIFLMKLTAGSQRIVTTVMCSRWNITQRSRHRVMIMTTLWSAHCFWKLLPRPWAHSLTILC